MASNAKTDDLPPPPANSDDPLLYKSSISARAQLTPTSGRRQFMNTTMRPNLVTSSSSRMAGSGLRGLGAGTVRAGSAEVNSAKTLRHKEKQDMQNLNERLANYIEKSRFLEAQNRKLTQDLDELRQKWGQETKKVKAMFETELKEARSVLDEAENAKTKSLVRNKSLEDELARTKLMLADMKKQHDKDQETIKNQLDQLASVEPELNMMRRRMQLLEEQKANDRKRIDQLTNDLNQLRAELEEQTVARMDADNRCQTLEEELAFLKSLHEQELSELQALACRESSVENKEFWKSELSSAIREIQQEYDTRLGNIRAELETQLAVKKEMTPVGAVPGRHSVDVVHTKEENKTLRNSLNELRNKLSDMTNRNLLLEQQLQETQRDLRDKEREWEQDRDTLEDQIAQLQAELESISGELQELADKKLSLELEIAAYGKLLQTEEIRTKHGTQTVSSSGSTGGGAGGGGSSGAGTAASGTVMTSGGSRVSFQRSAKGPISISETAMDGKWIKVENGGKKDESLDNWQLKRRLDAKQEIAFTFPAKFSIVKGKSIRIWARGLLAQHGSKENGDIEAEVASWGTGLNIVTVLLSDKGEEKSSLVQKTVV